MSYQIPQQLQYKEKIMFGLTFKQLAYAFGFGFLDILFLKKMPNIYVAVPFIFLFTLLAVMFMFFNLDQWIKNYRTYYLNRELLKDSEKMKSFLGQEIEKKKTKKKEEPIETEEGKEKRLKVEKEQREKHAKEDGVFEIGKRKISILRVQPINFGIKPEEEKQTIIYAFQKFLNSLDFPIQILMNTESIKIDSYVDSIEKTNKNENFKELFSKYKEHLQKTIVSDKLLNRIFYIIIPEKTNIELQSNICVDRLKAMNMKVFRLNNQEGEYILKDLEQDLIINNLDYLEIPNKGELKRVFEANKLIEKYNLENPNEPKKKEVEQKTFQRVVYASGYPRNVELGFLDRIVSSLADFNLSMHITPHPIDETMIALNKELMKQKADLYTMQSKGISNPSLEIQNNDTRHTLEELQKGKERLFNISLYVVCKADTKKKLDFLTKKVESELNSIMIVPQIPTFRMLQGLKSCLPLGIDELKETRNITTEALSAFFPFTSQFLDVDDGGVWIGNNNNGIPIIKDIFKLPNPNGLVLAQSGGGKSYFCKLLITRYLLNGTKVMIIDPQGEYKALVGHFKGQRVEISRESDTMINPLDMMGHDYIEKRLSLLDLMNVMLGKLSETQLAFIDRAISEAYERKGILPDQKTWDRTPPILGDVLKMLEKYEKTATPMEVNVVRSLVNKLGMYVTGVFSFMNKQTNINFENGLVCFDIGNMPKQVKPTIMFLVLDYVYMKMKSDLSKKILLIDEAWSLLGRTEDASYVFEIVKTCRKFNLGLLLINQEVEGLFETPAGKSVLANSAYTLLMRQKPAVIKNICSAFCLSEAEKQHLLTCGIGEGLLIMEDDHAKIKVKASPEEHKVITSNPSEVEEREKAEKEVKRLEQRPKKGINIDLNDDLGCFKLSKLNKEEQNFLLSKGYKISLQKSINEKKEQEYLIRPNFNESDKHFFVIHDIKTYLEKKGIEVQTFNTKKPDLVFKLKGKTIAIEVETGGKIRKDRKMIEDKVKELNENYDKWFFVVLNKDFTTEYRKFGKVVEFRYLKRDLIKIV